MLKVHHLNNSRSQRILWILEELGTPYEIVYYQRMEPLPLAPPELKEIHPLGKSPVITDDGVTVAESGAIIEYLLDKYGNGRMRPQPGTPDHVAYLQWMHYAEGSAMFPQLLALLLGMLGDGGAPLKPYVDMEIEKHLAYIEGALGDREFLVGDQLTGADVQIGFVLEAAAAGNRLADHPRLTRYLERLHARPASRRAIEGRPLPADVALIGDRWRCRTDCPAASGGAREIACSSRSSPGTGREHRPRRRSPSVSRATASRRSRGPIRRTRTTPSTCTITTSASGSSPARCASARRAVSSASHPATGSCCRRARTTPPTRVRTARPI